MFIYQRKIRVQDTDATGVLYFANQLQIALEALEEFLDVGELLRQGKLLLPIVHSEADFLEPVYVGDELKIELTTEKGEKSLTAYTKFFKGDALVGKCKIIHVVYSKTNNCSVSVDNLVCN